MRKVGDDLFPKGEEPLFKKDWDRLTSRVAFLRAIVRTFDSKYDNTVTRDYSGPGQEWYGNSSEFMEKHGLPYIRTFWAEETGFDETLFPWSTSTVMYTWVAFRKWGDNDKNRQRSDLGLPQIGPRPSSNG